MVTLPKDFVKTKFPGYFWNVKEQVLYSIKVTGELRPLKFQKARTFYNIYHPAGYRVSVDGHKRTLVLEYLQKLKATKEIQEIGIYGQE